MSLKVCPNLLQAYLHFNGGFLQTQRPISIIAMTYNCGILGYKARREVFNRLDELPSLSIVTPCLRTTQSSAKFVGFYFTFPLLLSFRC